MEITRRHFFAGLFIVSFIGVFSRFAAHKICTLSENVIELPDSISVAARNIKPFLNNLPSYSEYMHKRLELSNKCVRYEFIEAVNQVASFDQAQGNIRLFNGWFVPYSALGLAQLIVRQ